MVTIYDIVTFIVGFIYAVDQVFQTIVENSSTRYVDTKRFVCEMSGHFVSV